MISIPPLIDAHVHLWDPNHLRYGWLESIPALHRPYGVDEYRAATAGTEVEGMIFVECTESFSDAVSRREVDWVQSLRDDEARLQGIVAHASLEKGADVQAHLNWLSDQPLVTGVRRIVQDEAPDFLTCPDFVEGVQLLRGYDFSFDLTIQSHQLEAATELVDRCPNVQFVVDHLGKPQIRDGEWTGWTDALEKLSDRENVVCKISGVLTEADLDSWTYDDVVPYLEHAVTCFGIDRILYGGDWPVVRLAADYSTWLDVLGQAVRGWSMAERTALFRKNAERIYLR